MKFAVNNKEWELVLVNPNSKELMRSNGTITIGTTDNIKKKVFNYHQEYYVEYRNHDELRYKFYSDILAFMENNIKG